MKIIFLACRIAFLSLIVATSANASANAFFEGDFNPGEWNLATIPVFGGVTGQSAVQILAGGNPGSFRRVTTNTSSLTYMAHTNPNWVYNPTLRGPLNQVAWSISTKIFNAYGQGMAFGPLAVQGGKYYQGNYAITGSGDTSWQNVSYPNLTSANFTGLGTSIPINFINGDPISFGYFTFNFGGSEISIGYDNLSINLGTTPWKIQGMLSLQDTSSAGGTETIDWTLTDGTNTYTGTQIVASQGSASYTINFPTNIPFGSYSLRFKGGTFLAKTLNLTLSAANINAGTVNLVNGDIDQDGEVGPGDFEMVVSQFGGTGSADCDNDGEVGPNDFDIIVRNFGLGDE